MPRSSKPKSVITLFEKVDVEKLQLLMRSKDIDDDQRQQLSSYHKNKREDNTFRVPYGHSKTSNNPNRLYAQCAGLQNFKSDIRNFLCKDIYYDIDMSNSGPTLLLNYCLAKNILCTELKYYVRKRDKVFEQIQSEYGMTLKEAKKYMLKITNLGKHTLNKVEYCYTCGIERTDAIKGLNGCSASNDNEKIWACHECIIAVNRIKDSSKGITSERAIRRYRRNNNIEAPSRTSGHYKFLGRYANEIQEIANEICKEEKEIYALALKNKKTKDVEKGYPTDPRASVMSTIIFDIENQCLLSMVDYFKSKKIIVGSLCFDGLMIEKTPKIIDSEETLNKIIKECETYVLENIGYEIRLKNKPIEVTTDYELPEYSPYVPDDLGAVEKLLLIEGKDKFKYTITGTNNGGRPTSSLFVYDETKGIWKENNNENNYKTIGTYLKKNSQYLNVIVSESETKQNIKNYGRDAGYRNRIMCLFSQECEDEEWFNEMSMTSQFHLLFKDGVYDMNNNKFTKGFTDKIYFQYRVPHNFPERNEDDIKYAYDLSFGTLFDNPKPMIYALACALAGERELKKFYLCPGRTGAGKSQLVTMLSTVFGDYVQDFNGECLTHNKNSTREEAQELRWAMTLKHCRIIMSKELKMTRPLDGETIKKHSGGSDALVARGHGGNEHKFNVQYTPFCMLNDIPEIIGFTEVVERRLEYIEFPYQFVDKEEYTKDNENKQLLRDYDLMKKMREPRFIRGFMYILFDAYQDYLINGMPKFDKEAKERWTADTKQKDELNDIFEKKFHVTNDPNDFVSVSDINNFKKRFIDGGKTSITISLKLFKDFLLNKLKLIESRKKINTQNIRVYLGVKKRAITDDIDFD